MEILLIVLSVVNIYPKSIVFRQLIFTINRR